MIRYLIMRALRSLIVLFIFLSVAFFVIQLVMPGDFVSQFVLAITPDEGSVLRQRLGLDLPLGERYLNWLGQILQGDLGRSFSGPRVTTILEQTIPPTLLVFASGTTIAFALGLWLGKITAWRKPGFLTNGITLGAITLYATFPPWISFLLVYIFARQLQWFNPFAPTLAYDRKLWLNFPIERTGVMFYMVLTFAAATLLLIVINALLARSTKRRMPMWLAVPAIIIVAIVFWHVFGFGPQALNVLHIALLPIITYVLISFGDTLLTMRTSMADTINEQYVYAARAKGLPSNVVRDRHVARTALLPVLSRLVSSLPYLFGGVFIVEQALAWAGMGSRMVEALNNGVDVPLIMGLFIFMGVVTISARLALEIVQAYLDPRVRQSIKTAGDIR